MSTGRIAHWFGCLSCCFKSTAKTTSEIEIPSDLHSEKPQFRVEISPTEQNPFDSSTYLQPAYATNWLNPSIPTTPSSRSISHHDMDEHLPGMLQNNR